MINVFLLVVFIFMLFMIMKSDINIVCIMFVHLSSISLENFKDHALTIPEILELIKLHSYKFGLVYMMSVILFILGFFSCSFRNIVSYHSVLNF